MWGELRGGWGSVVITRTDNFEAHAQSTESGVEFWLARDLQHLLGYTEWRNFAAVVNKARTACEISGHSLSDHFVDVNKMVEIFRNGRRPSSLFNSLPHFALLGRPQWRPATG